MKTVPFNKAEALAGRKVLWSTTDNPVLADCGQVIYVDGNLAWVRWPHDKTDRVHATSYLRHEDLTPDPTPRPVDLLALNWPSIWVRHKGARGALLVLGITQSNTFIWAGEFKEINVGVTDISAWEMAPSPSGPWRPMVE